MIEVRIRGMFGSDRGRPTGYARAVVVDEINNLGGVAQAGQKLAQRTARHILGYGASSDIAALRRRKREMVDRYPATGDEVACPSRPHSFLEIDLRRQLNVPRRSAS